MLGLTLSLLSGICGKWNWHWFCQVLGSCWNFCMMPFVTKSRNAPWSKAPLLHCQLLLWPKQGCLSAVQYRSISKDERGLCRRKTIQNMGCHCCQHQGQEAARGWEMAKPSRTPALHHHITGFSLCVLHFGHPQGRRRRHSFRATCQLCPARPASAQWTKLASPPRLQWQGFSQSRETIITRETLTTF